MNATKQPMQLLMDLDWSTMHCPCGASIRGGDPSWPDWIAKHKPHSDGTYLEICTDDGARVYATKPDPILRHFGETP